MALVQKNDVNQIFAEQAPSIDKPARFSNYPYGWGVTRPNEGKPTIKEFNYLQQRTDQNILWIHQNGAALPYDENIEYADGAIVRKDGELQQLKDGQWKPTKDNDLIKTVESIDELIAFKNPKDGQVVFVKDNNSTRVYDENTKAWNLKYNNLLLENFGAREGKDNTEAFKSAFNFLREIGGGSIESNIRKHIVSDRVIYFDNTYVDLRGATVETTEDFCNALYNADKTQWSGHFGAEAYYRYAQALSVGNPFSKIQVGIERGATTIKVDSISGFARGDVLMLNNGYCDMYRTMETPAQTAAHIWNRDDVPLWQCEFVKIKDILDNNTIELESTIKNNYPLSPLLTSIFEDENALPEYEGWNTPSIIRLGGASNCTFKNIKFKKIGESQSKCLHASLATDIIFENIECSGGGYGVEITSCINSHILNTKTKTVEFGVQLRRSANSSLSNCSGFLLGNKDSSIIMYEGCHDSVARGINTNALNGIEGSNIGFYINTSWDCAAYDITANNAGSAVELSFSHDCKVFNVTAYNTQYLISNYGSRNNTITGGVLHSLKDKSATQDALGLIDTGYSNNIKYEKISSNKFGRVRLIKSFGIEFRNIDASKFEIYSDDQVSSTYKPELNYVNIADTSVKAITFATPDATIHNDREVVISNSTVDASVYFVNKANSMLRNVNIAGNSVETGLQLKSSAFTRVIDSSIGGTAHSIDFFVYGDASDHSSSTIYLNNTALKAPSKFKDYIYLGNYLSAMNPLSKNIQYISDLSVYPDIALIASDGRDGVRDWRLLSVTRNNVVWTTQERLLSATNDINTINKYLGQIAFNSSISKFMLSTGVDSKANWISTDGLTTITPA